MEEGLIMFVGPIGDFELSNGEKIKGIQLLDIVTKVMSFPETVKTIRIQYDTPGGRKDVGKNIYNYLLSLKPKYRIISEQIGMVGSIGTMPWFAGDDRIATRGEDFLIHNPWVPQFSGDADGAEELATSLRQTESELKAFYMERTGITDEGISPLMKAETKFRDEKAVEMKFATHLQEAHKIAAYMKTETQSKFMSFLNAMESFFSRKELNMVVELEGGAKIAFATEDASKLEGVPAFTVDEAGNPSQVPAPDGDYKMTDGKVVTVAGGVVTKVVDAAAPAAPPAPPAPPVAFDELAFVGKFDSILLAMREDAKERAKLEDRIVAKVNEELTKLRSEIGGTHIPGTYKSENHTALVAEWERSYKANEHLAMRKNEPEKYKALYYAKFGKMPNI
jgi:ATP-dependent protease ClpP protease subunit